MKSTSQGEFDPVAFGERLHTLRMQESLTQTQIASKLQVTQSSIAMLENGQRKPGADMLLQLYLKFPGQFRYLLTGSRMPTKDNQIEVTRENVVSLVQMVRHYEKQIDNLTLQLSELQDQITGIYQDIHQQLEQTLQTFRLEEFEESDANQGGDG